MTGKIFVITGPSGVGKGTICETLLREHPELTLSISATSRTMRTHEADGVNYHFKTREMFERMIANDAHEPDPQKHQLLEWAEYNGNYYGTPRQAVEASLATGRHVLLEIEVQGALIVKEKFPAACLIFILPPSLDELERRLRGRGTDAEKDILNRLQLSQQEIALRDQFDYQVVNDDLTRCLSEVAAIFKRCVAMV